jgi:hypothetical protein
MSSKKHALLKNLPLIFPRLPDFTFHLPSEKLCRENRVKPKFPPNLPVSDFQAALDVNCPDFVLKVLVISTLFKNID